MGGCSHSTVEQQISQRQAAAEQKETTLRELAANMSAKEMRLALQLAEIKEKLAEGRARQNDLQAGAAPSTPKKPRGKKSKGKKSKGKKAPGVRRPKI